MGTISASNLQTILDSVASAKLIFDAGLGTSSSQANSVSKAAANDQNTLSAIADPDVQADLAATVRLRAQAVLAANLYVTLGGYNLWWALDKHVGGLDAFLKANNVRVHQSLPTVGFPISQVNIMPPAVDPMATFAVTGSGAGTYAHVADVDTTQYGPAWLQAVVTATIGAAQIVATVTGKQFDQVTWVNKAVTIAANSSVGTTVNVGTLGLAADAFDSITGITITGGTSGDAFKISSRVERTISATS